LVFQKFKIEFLTEHVITKELEHHKPEFRRSMLLLNRGPEDHNIKLSKALGEHTIIKQESGGPQHKSKAPEEHTITKQRPGGL
jgi:hypothetical protein